MKRLVKSALLAILILPLGARAQKGWMGDTSVSHSRLSGFVGLDNRESYIRSKPVNVDGYIAGITWKQKHTFSLGYYFIPMRFREKPVKNAQPNDSLPPAFRDASLWYLSLGYSYRLLNTRYFDIELPLEAGFGESAATPNRQDVPGNPPPRQSKMFIPLQAGLNFRFKACRWVYLSGSIGYRKAVDYNVFRANYDGMYYSYGASIQFLRLWNDLFPKKAVRL